MLPLENLENPTFQEIMERAKKNIQQIYPTWTNYNPADSGMTIVELFAFLTEAQQFYLNQTGQSHYLAYLHLLGMCPNGICPASVYAMVQGAERPFLMLRGTKAIADRLVFESERTVCIEPDNLLVAAQRTPFYPFGENPENGDCYNINLRCSLEKGMVHSLHFDLYDEYPIHRNPVQKEEWIPLVQLRLEYFNGLEFRECQIKEDTTFGLLQTGDIQFYLPKKMERLEAVYPLRLIMNGEYDTAPLVNGIHFNMVSFVQRDTKVQCQQFVLRKEEKEFYEIVTDSWLAVNAKTSVYLQMQKGFRRITEFSSYMQEGKRHFVFAESIFDRLMTEIVICLVSYPQSLSRKELMYDANGMPDQQFLLPDRNVLRDSFAIWVEEAEYPGHYRYWSFVPDFAAAGKEDRCYVLDEENGILKFGNGKQGVIPKGRIEIISYATCGGSAGNIQKNQMEAFVEETRAAGLFNPCAAAGGKEPESIADCFKRYSIQSNVKKRAVTITDYEDVIKATPGLRIKKVKVFSSKERTNCLEAVVQPYTNGNRLLKQEAYDRNIIYFLEKKKMLGTCVIIQKPEYIKLSLQLEVVVKSRYLGVKERMEEEIEQYFEEEMDFGKTIVYSRLFGYIDALPEVSGISALTLYARGKGVVREDNMDIRLPFHGMACLEEKEIRCILTEEM